MMAKPEKVTISIDVKLPGKEEFRHLTITADMVSVAGKVAIDIQQRGDSEEADRFSANWLRDALVLVQRKSDSDKVPNDLH